MVLKLNNINNFLTKTLLRSSQGEKIKKIIQIHVKQKWKSYCISRATVFMYDCARKHKKTSEFQLVQIKNVKKIPSSKSREKISLSRYSRTSEIVTKKYTSICHLYA